VALVDAGKPRRQVASSLGVLFEHPGSRFSG
jgi:hypothetical protein